MRHLPCRYAVAGVFAGWLLFVGHFPAQTPAQKPQLGSITGKVMSHDKPVPGVVIGVRNDPVRSPYDPSFRATTDQEGRYRVTGLPSGSYQVTPISGAFVGKAQSLVMRDSENIDEINFNLVKGGVITGRVTDDSGHPVVEQRVSLFRADTPRGPQQAVYAFTSVVTDDRGVYRMFGLAAGRYQIGSGLGAENFNPNLGQGRSVYPAVYYPNTTDLAQAEVLEVSEGSETKNIDLMLGRAAPTYAASGKVIDGISGQPITNVMFGAQMMTGEGRNFVSGISSAPNSRGEFRLENLMPGKYSIFLFPQGNTDLYADAVSFEIIDHDVDGLVVKTSTGASIDGVVALDNPGDNKIWEKLLAYNIAAFSNGTQSAPISRTSPINPDGSFHIGGLGPGAVYFSLGTTGFPGGPALRAFYMPKIERGGVLQPRNMVEVKSNEHLTDIRVLVGYANSKVEGTVKVENGTLPDDARIVVRISRIGERQSFLRPPQVDKRGRFTADGLSAGNYEFTAMVMTQSGPSIRPITAKQQIAVSDDQVAEMTIIIDLSARPAP
jgi:hypothetical protein